MGDFYQTLSITSPGPATLPKPEHKTFQKRDLNDISDIDGAQSGPSYRLYTNKPQFLNSEIEGAVPKQLARTRNCRDNSLYIDDIEGTRHMIKDRMMRTGRHVNPLDPQYPLPSYVPVESQSTKFIKDPLSVDDIDGTRSKVKKEFPTRNILSVEDIDGARPGSKRTQLLHSINTRNVLAVEDISAKNHRLIDKTTRVTDPNNPIYHVNGMDIYDDKYTKPKEGKKFIPDNFLLKTKDINGATADTRYADPFVRREFKNTNFIGDIKGSHADSVKHSIVTNRNTHPLQPVYQALDPGELLLPLIPPLLPPELVKVPTLPQINREGGKGIAAVSQRPKSNSQAEFDQTWGTTQNDLDPVLFTSDLNGTNQNHSSNGFSLPLPKSGRTNNQTLFSANGTNVIQKDTAVFNPPTSGRDIISGRGKSPGNSYRKNSGRPSVETGYLVPANIVTQRKVQAERQAEIDLVRSLQ